ncbi:hypothetical protein ACELLULO517_15645 [Acidisoma cellulosilytica]|uniref:Uncharacterized protein n=1 Tax=Acidisoma cellulosilyticum TaxID=2802395 RepID=A0A963Z357_9PROT|nr:hypothetical protein [Acidisoma cellulosilyticum]MCB8881681.1 hypothetical protein [Acidisoma cellulosilyticum]
MSGDLYDFFRDQGGIIAGVLALGAALIANRGAKSAAKHQVDAMERQAKRVLARDNKIAENRLLGMLSKTDDDIQILKKRLEASKYYIENAPVVREVRQTIRKPNLDIVWNDIGRFGEEFVALYMTLDNRVDDFINSDITEINAVKNELAEFDTFVTVLENHLKAAAKKTNGMILETEKAPARWRGVSIKRLVPFRVVRISDSNPISADPKRLERVDKPSNHGEL